MTTIPLTIQENNSTTFTLSITGVSPGSTFARVVSTAGHINASLQAVVNGTPVGPIGSSVSLDGSFPGIYHLVLTPDLYFHRTTTLLVEIGTTGTSGFDTTVSDTFNITVPRDSSILISTALFIQNAAADGAYTDFIADTAANISANLDSLESFAKAGRIDGIKLSNGAPLVATGTQLGADADAIALISGPVTVNAVLNATPLTYTLAPNIKNITLFGTASAHITGNSLGNIILGNSGDDVIQGGSGKNILDAGLGKATLIGGSGDNDLYTTGGVINMVGGGGNNTFHIDTYSGSPFFATRTVSVESPVGTIVGGGLHNALSTSTWHISRPTDISGLNISGVQQLLVGSFFGAAATPAQFNGFSDIRADGDQNKASFEPFADTVLVLATPGAVDFSANVLQQITLTVHGSSGNDTISGHAGIDVLNGEAGLDALSGRGGADKFVFDAAAQTDARAATPIFDHITDYNQGNSGSYSDTEGDQIDLSTLLSTAYNHGSGQPVNSLVRAIEDPSGTFANLQIDLDGAASGVNWMTIARLDGLHPGNNLSIILDASLPAGTMIAVGNDTPTGNLTLVSSPGADIMNGGAGFDLATWLNETSGLTLNLANQALNAGSALGDTVSNVEAFYLTNFVDSFIGGSTGVFVYGFDGNDKITGSSVSDIIDGGPGADTIDAGAGFDYVSYYSSAAGVTVDLKNPANNTGDAKGDLVTNAEAYILTSKDDTFVGTDSGQNIVFGYEGNDKMTGGFNANNWFFAGDGNDRMVGGGVQDLFVGGNGADTIVLATPTPIAGSSVFGFTPGTDVLEISRAAFGLSAGYAVTAGSTLVSGTGPAATTAQPTFFYYTNLGLLYFDPDGTGSTAATLLAQFDTHPALTAADFHLV